MSASVVAFIIHAVVIYLFAHPLAFPARLVSSLRGQAYVVYVCVSISTVSVARGPQQMFREEEKDKRREGRNGRIWGKLIINPTVSR